MCLYEHTHEMVQNLCKNIGFSTQHLLNTTCQNEELQLKVVPSIIYINIFTWWLLQGFQKGPQNREKI